MADLLAWALANVGLTTILTQGRIFKPIRDRLGWKFLCCPLCVGFWAGVGLSLLGLSLFRTPLLPLNAFFNGLAASGVCWIAYVVLTYLGGDKL